MERGGRERSVIERGIERGITVKQLTSELLDLTVTTKGRRSSAFAYLVPCCCSSCSSSGARD